MSYFPCNRASGKIKIDGEKISLDKIEFLFSRLDNVRLDDLPYPFYGGSAVVVNNQIHVLGGTYNGTAHYALYRERNNREGWMNETPLPYSFSYGGAVTLGNEIHIFGGSNSSDRTKHYKWDGTTWTQVSTLPYMFFRTCVVVYNNEIHILGGGNSGANKTKHYKWDGTTWTQVSTLPYMFDEGMAVTYDGAIHIFGGNDGTGKGLKTHYKWNGTTWTRQTDLPNYGTKKGLAVTTNDGIYAILSTTSNDPDVLRAIYKFNSRSNAWESVGVSLPHTTMSNSYSVVCFSDEIHSLGGTEQNYNKEHYKLAVKQYSMVIHN